MKVKTFKETCQNSDDETATQDKQPKRTPNPLLKDSVKVINDKTPLENDWELD